MYCRIRAVRRAAEVLDDPTCRCGAVVRSDPDAEWLTGDSARQRSRDVIRRQRHSIDFADYT